MSGQSIIFLFVLHRLTPFICQSAKLVSFLYLCFPQLMNLSSFYTSSDNMFRYFSPCLLCLSAFFTVFSTSHQPSFF